MRSAPPAGKPAGMHTHVAGPAARRRARLQLLWTALVVVSSAALLVAAVAVPAPGAALPFLVLACVGLPVVAARRLDAALAALACDRRDHRALDELRRALARLPETEHPLGR